MFVSEAYAESNDVIKIQETESVPVESSPLQSGWTNLMPMILIFVVFYFLLIRPQEKKRRQKEALIGGVKKGEKVITNGGIFGTVHDINDSDGSVELEIASGVNIKILKTAIADITSRKPAEGEHRKIVSKDTKKDKRKG